MYPGGSWRTGLLCPCTHKEVSYTCTTCGETKTEPIPTLAHSHSYVNEIATQEYLKSEATCRKKAVYYKSCKCDAKGTETFESGNLKQHVYDQEVAAAKYLVSEATQTERAVYKKSCICGKAGTETFEYGGLKPREFKDVPKNAYFYDAVMWAVENKITTGTGDGTTFEPNANCTRGQVITFLWRAYTK